MYLLVSASSCSDPGLARILLAVKNMLSLIQIIAPIVLLIMASINLFQLMMSPDDKKKVKRIINSFIAAAVLFFIPMLVNVVMSIVGSNTTVSDCWNKASSTNTTPGYMDPNDSKSKTKIYTDPSEYH
jgi:hypothetical protein